MKNIIDIDKKISVIEILQKIVIGVCIFFVILGIILLYPVLKSNEFELFCTSCDIAKFSILGQIGGYLAGTLGVCWGIASVFLIYLTFLGQRSNQLQQEKEIRLAQAQSQKQHFEMVLFNMISIIPRIVSGYVFGNKDGNQYMNERLNEIRTKHGDNADSTELEVIIHRNNLHKDFNNFINHVANAFRLITSSEILSDSDRGLYYNILNGVLTPNQKALLIALSKTELMKSINDDIQKCADVFNVNEQG